MLTKVEVNTMLLLILTAWAGVGFYQTAQISGILGTVVQIQDPATIDYGPPREYSKYKK